MIGDAEFSVYWWDPDGNYYKEREGLTSESAVDFAMGMTRRPAAQIGIVKKIMITDGGDCSVFEWEFGKGITHPTPQALQEAFTEKRLNELRSRYEGVGPELSETEMSELRTLENESKQ